MDILKTISSLLDQLESDPSGFDLDYIKSVLGEAYRVSRQGLELSNDALKYRKLKKDFDELSQNHTVVKDKIADYETKIADLQSCVDQLQPLFSTLKSDLLAKVSLISRYSEDKKRSLYSKISESDPKKLVELKINIESDFNSDWSENDAVSVFQSGENIDFTPFKIGV